MDFFTAMEVTASGLTAQRTRINALASNLANAQTTRTQDGQPYKRLDPVFRAVPLGDRFERLSTDPAGRAAYLVEVPEIREDNTAPQEVYDPNHPDADENGFIKLPNVHVVQEMVNLITASRAYEAGVSAMKNIKSMAQAALSIGA